MPIQCDGSYAAYNYKYRCSRFSLLETKPSFHELLPIAHGPCLTVTIVASRLLQPVPAKRKPLATVLFQLLSSYSLSYVSCCPISVSVLVQLVLFQFLSSYSLPLSSYFICPRMDSIFYYLTFEAQYQSLYRDILCPTVPIQGTCHSFISNKSLLTYEYITIKSLAN
jgi:hypothetical protein